MTPEELVPDDRTAESPGRDASGIGLARIRDTLFCDELLVSAALLDEVATHPELEVVGDPAPRTAAGGDLGPWSADSFSTNFEEARA